MAYINNGSLLASRKHAGVTKPMWATWMTNPTFVEIYATIKNPVVFAHRLGTAIIFKAMKRHWEMLDDEKMGVRQWAVERAYNLDRLASNAKNPDDKPVSALTQGDIKQLVAGALTELGPSATAQANRAPFQTVDAEFTAIEETIEV